MFWTRHVREGRDLLRRAFETANQIGDLTFAAYYYTHLNTYFLAAGDPLDNVQVEVEHGLAFARNMRFGLAVDFIAGQLGLIRTLRGLTPIFGCFDDEQFDELLLESRFCRQPGSGVGRGLVLDPQAAGTLLCRRLCGCPRGLIEGATTAAGHRRLCSNARNITFTVRSPEQHSASPRPAGQRQEHVEALAAHHRQLEVWATACPENFENRAALVGAEIARIEGRELDAEHLYEQAIHSAQANGFVHNEALANEVAARFYAARGFEKIARCLSAGRAVRLHPLGRRWQGTPTRRVVSAPQGGRAGLPAPTSTIGAPVEQLDLATVIKVSQAVSGEIVLEKLIDTLMRTAIEQAGAERGLLILARVMSIGSRRKSRPAMIR